MEFINESNLLNKEDETKFMDKEIVDDEVWKSYESYAKEHHLISHQISSYDDFITNSIPKIIEKDCIIEAEGYKLHLHDVKFDKPTHKELDDTIRPLFPTNAMRRDIAYNSKMYIDIDFYSPAKENDPHPMKEHTHIHFGLLSVLTGSKLCNRTAIADDEQELVNKGEDIYDLGGYFISKGGAIKIIASQQQTAFNQIYVFQKRTKAPKFDVYAEVRSCDSYFKSNAVYVGIKKNIISVTIPYVDGVAIPLNILLAALGVVDIQEMLQCICPKGLNHSLLGYLVNTLERYYPFMSQKQALIYIGGIGKKIKKTDDETTNNNDDETKLSYAKHLLTYEFLPHLSTSFVKKKIYIGMMTLQLLEVLDGKRHLTDRDHYEIKVIARIGDLFGQLFNSAYKKFRKEIVKIIEKKVKQNDGVNLVSIIKPSIIQTIMSNAITSNMWTGKKKTPGISQTYERFNYAAIIANARKFVTTINPKGGKIEGPRQLHPSHHGAVCPGDTPEGKKCGLVANAAISVLPTCESDPEDVISLLYKLSKLDVIKMIFITDEFPYSVYTPVFVNGRIVGYSTDPIQLTTYLRTMRRRCELNYETGICYSDYNDRVTIRTDYGRMSRPLFIVENGLLKYKKKHELKLNNLDGISSWMYLMEKGLVEIIDKHEEAESYIVMYPSDLQNKRDCSEVTHCEIHPSLMYGSGIARLPLCDHNQCVHHEEPVIMFDGSSKKISDVVVGDEVITFNPETQEHSYTTVVATHTGPTKKDMFKVTTYSGRTIVTTFDHRFMTSLGWKRMEELKVTNLEKSPKTLVAVSLDPKPMSSKVEKECIILTQDDFRRIMIEHGVRPSIAEKQITDLINNNFLPLRNTDKRLYILARLFGACLTDGCIFISGGVPRMSFDSGSRDSCDMIERDIERLGLPRKEAKYYEKEFHGSVRKSWKIEHASFLPSLIIALGYNPGKKTIHEYPKLQDWIMKGSDVVKREFLSAFQGGDGCKIRNVMRKNGKEGCFNIAQTAKLASFEHTKSLENMMSQIVSLLRYFDVVVGDIRTRKGKAKDRNMISYKISESQANLIQYFDIIGYRYDTFKIVESGKIVEYLKYRQMCKKDKIKNIIPIKVWNSVVKHSHTTLFIPIHKIEKVENVLISDITTESTNQSFLAGDRFGIHNSPRNAYHAAMVKQAIGIPCLNCFGQTKSKTYIINYPQKGLVTTRASDILGLEKLPVGQNAMIAICPWYGYGQEDAILINHDSVQRGFMGITILIPFYCKIKKEKDEVLCFPKEDECYNYKGNASKLNPLTGYVNVGDKIIKGDILIGAVVNAKDITQPIKRVKKSISILYDQVFPGVVHNIDHGYDGDGYEYIRVIIAQQRDADEGDKFSTSAGQKGTCGYNYKAIDGIISQVGICPDIIMNPLAFPSRMTIAVLIEILIGRLVCEGSFLNSIPISKLFQADAEDWNDPEGENKPFKKFEYTAKSMDSDGTPFRKDFSISDICAELVRLGINGFSEEEMINGQTGEQLNTLIYTGVCQYMRLKHMVIDKVHARARGGRTRIMRQPKEGRRLGGGFRIGTMERDVIISNGASFAIRDRLLEQSDITNVWFCKLCGLQAIVTSENPESKIPPTRECRVCDTNKVAMVSIGYATKLLIQEFLGMHLCIRMVLTRYAEISDMVPIYAGANLIGTGMLRKV